MVVLADTSALIEYFGATGGPAHLACRSLVSSGEAALTDPVLMEVLAGVSRRDVAAIRQAAFDLLFLPVAPVFDYESAAEIYRSCRAGGETVRGLIDCLIAAVAIREDAELLHNDADFEAIARHTALRIYRP
ncbi:MAG: type II toxin-antitoxin system VapC family toxin [Actinomycetota bacterium]